MFFFRKIRRALFSCYLRFNILSFALIPDDLSPLTSDAHKHLRLQSSSFYMFAGILATSLHGILLSLLGNV